MSVVSLTHEKFRRERFVIILAAEVREIVGNEDPLDPEPLAPFLVSMADELRLVDEGELRFRYRSAIEFFATPPGELVRFSIELEPHHSGALTWACGYLAEVENALGIRLMERGRSNA
jgi:hypothetical protein